MVSDKYMKMVLEALSSRPIPLRLLSARLRKPQGAIREALDALAEFGLVAKVDLPGPARRPPNEPKVGWRKIK
jgi:hypothetical protein